VTNDLGELLRVEGGRSLATLTRVLGDLQLAEDALQDAVITALERWPRDGIPDRPSAWLTVTARHKAVDRLRREARRSEKEEAAVKLTPGPGDDMGGGEDESVVRDDLLRMTFTCCHPALSPDARVALSLRTLGGLTTAEIAHAFLVPEPTMAQRIVRAKHKIATAKIPYRVPPDHELPERLPAVLTVIYVIFTEGHAPHSAESVVRVDLCDEAIRLARLLAELMPDEPEVEGLLALLLLTNARRAARLDANGDIVLLEAQDRSLWESSQIEEGAELTASALRRAADRPGPYTLQAAIAACHSTAPAYAATDWSEIAALYEQLEALHPAPIIRLNRAVAIAQTDGPAAGLALADTIEGLDRSHRLHLVRATCLQHCGRTAEARSSYERAIELCPSGPERRLLERQLADLR
jgi:RNA polymerase sigma-70 factor (ECF subfamily)